MVYYLHSRHATLHSTLFVPYPQMSSLPNTLALGNTETLVSINVHQKYVFRR